MFMVAFDVLAFSKFYFYFVATPLWSIFLIPFHIKISLIVFKVSLEMLTEVTQFEILITSQFVSRNK